MEIIIIFSFGDFITSYLTEAEEDYRGHRVKDMIEVFVLSDKWIV